MENIAALTQQYGYWVIFLGMVASGFLPIPGELVLLIGGALAFSGRLELGAVLGLAVAGLAIGDTLLYWLGRKIGVRRERQLVAVYCRWASCTLGSVYCHEAARSYVARFKGSVLVIGKFMPGVGRFIPPVAGMAGIPYPTFFLLYGLGSTLWAGTFVGLGYLVHEQWAAVGSGVGRFGSIFFLLLVLLLVLVMLWKRYKGWWSGRILVGKPMPTDGCTQLGVEK